MAYITGLATNICKPISTNSHSVSTDDSIRSTLSAPCPASQVTSPHRLTQNSTQEIGNTPHVVAVGDNRIGMSSSFGRPHSMAQRMPFWRRSASHKHVIYMATFLTRLRPFFKDFRQLLVTKKKKLR